MEENFFKDQFSTSNYHFTGVKGDGHTAGGVDGAGSASVVDEREARCVNTQNADCSIPQPASFIQ